LFLVSACAQHAAGPVRFAPPPGFVARTPATPDIGVVILVDGAIADGERAALQGPAEKGLLEALTRRGYRPRVLSRLSRTLDRDELAHDNMDAPDVVLTQRQWALTQSLPVGLPAVIVARFQIWRTNTPADLRSANGPMVRTSLGKEVLEAYFNVYAWDATSLLFYRQTSYNDNLNFVLPSKREYFDSRGTSLLDRGIHALAGTTNSVEFRIVELPTDVWGESIGRILVGKVPGLIPLGPDLVEPAGFPIPATDNPTKNSNGYSSIAKRKWDLANDVPGEETANEIFQDGAGNIVMTFQTGGVVWGWEVEPAAGRPYLFIDPVCSGKPTERWLTVAEGSVSPPACAKNRALGR
jgi:hypothetical protein